MDTLRIPVRITKVIPLTINQKLRISRRREDQIPYSYSEPVASFAISTKGKIEMVRFADILYVESESNYTRFHLKDNGMVFASKTLKDVSVVLEKAGFIRVHKSFILHASKVKQYDISGGFLLLHTGEKIPVSRSNKKMVADKLLIWSC